uniref:Uncharacterized protein n=1 Tax=Setaria viridis TaxID=4556 RepID=A0A4U6VBK4_SETVI|nr:hypothetical protein SEVIR_3G130050v2 [Setaria viridis]
MFVVLICLNQMSFLTSSCQLCEIEMHPLAILIH